MSDQPPDGAERTAKCRQCAKVRFRRGYMADGGKGREWSRRQRRICLRWRRQKRPLEVAGIGPGRGSPATMATSSRSRRSAAPKARLWSEKIDTVTLNVPCLNSAQKPTGCGGDDDGRRPIVAGGISCSGGHDGSDENDDRVCYGTELVRRSDDRKTLIQHWRRSQL